MSLLQVLKEHADFRKLFTGTLISLSGSGVSVIALPLAAATYLGASPIQLGALGAATFLPNLLLGLHAGMWITRLSFRRILVLADLLRFLLLGSIPVSALTGTLSMGQLYAVVFLAGTCALFESVAAESFIQILVPPLSRNGANSAMAASVAAVSTAGSALGGYLVQLLSAPSAIALDALSFLASAIWKSRIRSTGSRSAYQMSASGRTPSTTAGFKILFRHPTMRSVMSAAIVGAFGGQMQAVLVVLYLVRDLHLNAATVGVVVASGGLAGLVSAIVASWIIQKLGIGPTFVVGMLIASISGVVFAVAGGGGWLLLVTLLVAQVLRGAGPSLFSISQQGLRQSLIPLDLLPQALGTWRLLVYGVQPVGALLGGILGEVLGLRGAFLVSSTVMLAGTATAYISPLRRLNLPSAQ